jgi:hypothetical protein
LLANEATSARIATARIRASARSDRSGFGLSTAGHRRVTSMTDRPRGTNENPRPVRESARLHPTWADISPRG